MDKVIKKWNKEMLKSMIDVLTLIQSIPDVEFEKIFTKEKTLAEKLSDVDSGETEDCYGAMARCSLAHFIEVMDKFSNKQSIGDSWTWDDLKQAMKESVK